MPPRRYPFLFAFALLSLTVFFAIGCGRPASPEASDDSGTPVVFAVNYPLADFARTLGSHAIEVQTPDLAGAHADDYYPSPEAIVEMQGMALILLNGAEFSSWADVASLPAARTVRTANTFRDRWLPTAHAHGDEQSDHQHGPEGSGLDAHEHVASYTWLDPALAAMQARAVAEAIIRIRPEDESAIRQRLGVLEAALKLLSERVRALKESSLPVLLAAEPHYQYLASAAGLNLHDTDWHWENDEPHDGMESLRALVASSGARHLIVPEEPQGERALVLRELGLVPVVIGPLGTPKQSHDATNERGFVSLMDANIAALEVLLVEPSAQ